MVRRSRDRKAQSGVPVLAIVIVLFVFTFAVMVFSMLSWRTSNARIYSGYQREEGAPSRFENIDREGPGFKGYIIQLEDMSRKNAELQVKYESLEKMVGFVSLAQFEDKLATLKNRLEKIRDGNPAEDNLMVMISRLQKHIDLLDDQLTATKEDKKKADTELESARTQLKERSEQYDTRSKALADDLAKKGQELNEVRGSLEAKISELQGKIVSVGTAAEKDRLDNKKMLAVAIRERDQFQTALEAVKKDRTGSTDYDPSTATPSGSVLSVDKTGAACMIDLGQKHGARVGLQFTVYETGPGGKRIEKGTIQLKKMFPDFSYAAILSVKDELNPILRDDVALSPLFRRGASTVFVLETDIDRVERSVLKQKIEKFGNKVSDTVCETTDYVVIKDQPGPMAKEAKQWGVHMVRVSDINKVLGED